MMTSPQRPPTQGTPCPGCGIAVQPGYARCPRCQTLLPRGPQPAPRPAGMRALSSGGTSVADEGRKWVLIAVAAGVVTFAVALTIFFATRGGDEVAEAEIEVADEEVEEVADPELNIVDPSLVAPDPKPADDRVADAARSLGASLKRASQWATVRVDSSDPGAINIQSAQCDETALQQVVQGALGDLRASGVTAVRCTAPHGAVIFEQNP